jgi:hypothetical protein
MVLVLLAFGLVAHFVEGTLMSCVIWAGSLACLLVAMAFAGVLVSILSQHNVSSPEIRFPEDTRKIGWRAPLRHQPAVSFQPDSCRIPRIEMPGRGAINGVERMNRMNDFSL